MAENEKMDEFLKEIETHRHEFYRYIYRNVWDSSVAEDVFSASILTAYQNRYKYTPGTNFRAWMYKILTNQCFVANREIGRRGEDIDEYGDSFIKLAQESDYPDVMSDPEAFLQECGDEVYISFKKLSTAQRSCILLKDIAHFRYQEIAEILDIPIGTVMTHLSRGRTKLRKLLLKYAREQGFVCKRFNFGTDGEESGGNEELAKEGAS